MAANIGPRIGIDGENEYRKSIMQLIQQGKTLDAQMRAVGDSFATEAEAQEAAAQKSELLTKRIEAQREQVKLLADMVEKSAQATDSDSSATLKWEEALANATAQLHKLEAGARESEDAVEDMGQEMDDAGRSAMSMGDFIKAHLTSDVILEGLKALAGLLKEAGEFMVSTVKESAAYGDEFLSMATVTGLSTDTLQEFRYMAELTDTSLDTITGSMAKLIKSMNSAKGGTGDAAAAFSALGVSVTDGSGQLRDNEAVFYELIDALGKIPNETERDAAAMAIFGKSAHDLNSLIAQGSAGISAFAEEAHRVGYVLDSEALAALGAADDSFQRLSLTGEMIKNKFGLALAPAAEDLSYWLLDLSEKVDWDAWADRVERFADALISFLEWTVDHAGQVEAGAEKVGKFVTFLSGSLGPIGEVRSAMQLLGGAAEEIGDRTEKPRQMLQELFSDTDRDGNQLAANAFGWGADMMIEMANGILTNVFPVYGAVRRVAGIISSYLHFSVPDKGPLSDFDQSPKDMLELYAKGLDENAWRVEDAVAGLAANVETELSIPETGARGGSYSYGGFNIYVYGAEGQDEEALADAVMDRIQAAIDAKEAVFA